MTPLRGLPIVVSLLALAGCGWNPLAGILGGGPGPGIVTGTLTYGGEPAGEKRVLLTLPGSSDPIAHATTDANGRFTFRGQTGKRVQVFYVSAPDQQNKDINPNEVQSWRSLPLDLTDGSGKEVPSFDVAYNGLLYPENLVALVVSESSLVPFHWSVHPNAKRYRVHVTSDDGSFSWASEWDSQPTAVFGKTVTPGHYNWQVEIDGGDAGAGTSRPRIVDMGPP